MKSIILYNWTEHRFIVGPRKESAPLKIMLSLVLRSHCTLLHMTIRQLFMYILLATKNVLERLMKRGSSGALSMITGMYRDRCITDVIFMCWHATADIVSMTKRIFHNFLRYTKMRSRISNIIVWSCQAILDPKIAQMLLGSLLRTEAGNRSLIYTFHIKSLERNHKHRYRCLVQLYDSSLLMAVYKILCDKECKRARNDHWSRHSSHTWNTVERCMPPKAMHLMYAFCG